SGAKRKENLAKAGPLLERNRKLVRLATDVPLTLDWKGWRLGDWDAPRLLALFREWGFRRFADQVRDSMTEPAPAKGGKAKKEVQGELFADQQGAPADGKAAAPVRKLGWKATYHLVDTPEQFQAFFDELKKQKRFAIDLETTDLDPRRAEVVGLAVCWKP